MYQSQIMNPMNGAVARRAREAVLINETASLRQAHLRLERLENRAAVWDRSPIGIRRRHYMAHQAIFGQKKWIDFWSPRSTVRITDEHQADPHDLAFDVDCAMLSIQGLPCLPLCENYEVETPPLLTITCNNNCAPILCGESGTTCVLPVDCVPATPLALSAWGRLKEALGTKRRKGEAPAALAPSTAKVDEAAPVAMEGAVVAKTSAPVRTKAAGCGGCSKKKARAVTLGTAPIAVLAAFTMVVPDLQHLLWPLLAGAVGAMATMAGGFAPLVEPCCTCEVDLCDCCADLSDCTVQLPTGTVITTDYGRVCVNGTCYRVPLLECNDECGEDEQWVAC